MILVRQFLFASGDLKKGVQCLEFDWRSLFVSSLGDSSLQTQRCAHTHQTYSWSCNILGSQLDYQDPEHKCLESKGWIQTRVIWKVSRFSTDRNSIHEIDVNPLASESHVVRNIQTIAISKRSIIRFAQPLRGRQPHRRLDIVRVSYKR